VSAATPLNAASAAETEVATPPRSSEPAVLRRRPVRMILLLTGLLVPQLILFGEALVGRKILLPLDVLTHPYHYGLPPAPDVVLLHQMAFSDLVTHNEPERIFAAAELRAGRVPLWNPYIYAGSPFAVWPVFAPHTLIYALCPTPVTLAWLQLGKALVAGAGAYLFFRRVLGVGAWPALLGAWSYPLTGYFVVWQGAVFTYAIAGLPWLLLTVDQVITSPRGWSGPALCFVTVMVAISSSPDFTALALLACGLYALWRLGAVHGWNLAAWARPALVLSCAWGLGLVMALPYLAPLFEHARSSLEMAWRQDGFEARPPMGVKLGLPQTLLPRIWGPFGTPGTSHLQDFPDALVTSNAAGYAGLLASLWLAPLAWLKRSERYANAIWLVWIVLGLAWSLEVPGLIHLMRLPMFNGLPYYRWVFISAFGIVALAVVGIEALAQRPAWQHWCWLFVGILALLGGWCVWQAVHWPEPLATEYRDGLLAGGTFHGIPSFRALSDCQLDFARQRWTSAGLCAVAIGGWLYVLRRPSLRWMYYVLTGLWLAELVALGPHCTPQCDPSLYYPNLSVFEALRRAEPGRIMGFMCFPPNYCVAQQLADVRGYDGMTPTRLADVLDRAKADKELAWPPTPFLLPRFDKTERGSLRPAPIYSMLHVRYFLARAPVDGLSLKMQGDAYFVYENPAAVPRVYVPEEVMAVDSERGVLARIAEPDFEPRRTAYIEGGGLAAGSGSVSIVDEVPTRITIQADMHKPGLIVLADRWDAGWRAFVEGNETPIVRTNYLLRGVAAPAGRSTIVFSYEPRSFHSSLRWAGAALAVALLWLVSASRPRRLK
jgi:hypothetical protein